MAKPYSDDMKAHCRGLYCRGWRIPEISKETKIPRRTLYDWEEKYNWSDLVQTDDIEEAYKRRILALLNRSDDMTPTQLNELESLQGSLFKYQKQQGRIAAQVPDGQAGPILEAAHQVQVRLPLEALEKQPPPSTDDTERNPRKGRRLKNDFRGIGRDEVLGHFREGMFGYQLDEFDKVLADKNNKLRRRFYLKSRQIGWTFYCAREAFALALIEGRNKAFLSASKSQSRLFKRYILAFAMQWFGVEIKGGDEVTIQTDHGPVTFWFLSTNSNTAQGPSGDVYLDEVFWIRDFEKLEKLAGAIASHKHYRKTYFSTPSTQSHDAYQIWSGARYLKKREKDPTLPDFVMPDAKSLRRGVAANDGFYRKVISIHDAMAGGCDLFDLHDLMLENDDESFKQLYECHFIDDKNSAFVLDQLLRCAANDSRWPGYKPDDVRPYGERPVVIGYDPSRSRDSAEVVVLAVPLKKGGKFTLLKRVTMLNENWAFQARTVKELIDQFNTVFVAIDVTGPGSGVFEAVQEHYPAAVPLHYSVEVKNRLVLKAQSMIKDNRVQWDGEHADIPMAFMAIKRQATANGITYVASRDKNIGHADVAWAIMHALQYEPLTSTDGSRRQTTCALSEAA
ncbi:terminase large subunit domain-containing protein [Oceanobacter mangrovi]|uniref:terminase large subunit domain-containing protein n=1 Tax=Oceanobacter mangrovi TaxID=2862510 RepID=UPI001C8D47AD|nr:terminase family protein [Oceanobacter mangrovi]